MSRFAERWGVLQSYHGWTGELVEATPEAEQAVLAAMGAGGGGPPRARRHRFPPGLCASAPDRAWGWAVQLYALRSRDSWGIGDMADLRRFARWSRAHGASQLLLNPLGAQAPTLPHQPSPYYTSSRRFRNILYLRIDDVDGAERVAAELGPLRAAAQALNQQRLIDYDEVYRIKSQALEHVHRAAPEPPGLAGWVTRQGRALRDFATFNALVEAHGPAWRSWPAELRRPDGEGVERRRQELAQRVALHEWMQFHLDRQLARAGREISLITDVPVGFASDGFDAWRWQDLLAPGMRVGAPPDEFFRDGQDWGLPAFDPWKLRRAHFEPFVDAIRGAASHAGGVRLDHVMGLFRLFWIPAGISPVHGLYVHYPAAELVPLLALESRRAGAFVIGEDLGLVQPLVRRRLRQHGVLSYRLLWFEGSSPGRWAEDAVAAATTHDLPTIGGIWTLSEPEHRLHHLRERLVAVTGLPDSAAPVDVAVAVYARLARGRTRLVLATLDDALGVESRPNVPGTTTQFPNWRLALPSPLEEIERADGVQRVVEAMNAGRARRSRPARPG
jgi:4-alpha-glucanotransferase